MDPPELKLKNCPGEAWVGNGKCDDEVNIPECNYDGGDCCMEPYVQGFCTICVCYENWLGISREINYLCLRFLFRPHMYLYEYFICSLFKRKIGRDKNLKRKVSSNVVIYWSISLYF